MSIKKWARETLRNLDGIQRKACTQLFSDIIQSSPIADPTLWKTPQRKSSSAGKFRANWQVSLDSPTSNVINSSNHSAAIPAMITQLGKSTRHNTIYFQNNVPYAQRLEAGHSSQTAGANNIVGKNVLRWDRIVRTATKL